MDEERLSKEQDRQFLKLMEESALKDYPNPERIGCPGSEFLKQLATDRKSIQLSDSRLEHVPRCSPCFRDFKQYRDAANRAKLTRTAFLSTAALLAVALIALLIFNFKKPVPDQANFQTAELDLFHNGVTRGGDTQEQTPQVAPALPRKRLDLQITLPFASEEGDYEVQVVRSNSEPTGLTAAGKAKIVDGKTLLKVRLDLSSLPPDSYKIGIRRIPYSWNASAVEVR